MSVSVSNYKGFLMASGVNDEAIRLPNRLLESGGYTTTPNMREEIKAERNDYTRELYRVTAPVTKTRIKFKTIQLNLSDLKLMQDFFDAITTDSLQRKVRIVFWDCEKFEYRWGYFYITDINYTIDEATEDDIFYQPIEVSFIEY